jgi:hypothetical protein
MVEQIEKEITVCQYKCGGPKKGLAFPFYQGPLTSGAIERNCFVCGGEAELKLKVERNDPTLVLPIIREIGVCKKHLVHAGIDPKDFEKPKGMEIT